MSERVSLPIAAEILGMSPQGVREHMKRNLFSPPIGYVTNPSGRQYQYRIYKKMLEEHIGREIEAGVNIGKKGTYEEMS